MATEIGDWLNEHTPGFDDEAPPEGNELVVEGTNYREEYFQEDAFLHHNVGLAGEEGPWGILEGTIAYDAWKIVSDLNNGAYLDSALGAIGVGATAAGISEDPLAFVGTQIASWMLEHVEPLRKAFDSLMGNPDMVEAYAGTWTEISKELTAVRADWQSAIDSEIATWSGQTAIAYRNYATTLLDQIGAAGGAAAALATIMEKTAKIVDAVRTMVHSILTALYGALFSWTIELALSGGTAAPVVAVQATTRIAAETVKVSTLITKMQKVLTDMGPYKEALLAILETLLAPEGAPA
ncbi:MULTISPECIES: WXG100 family type VII secretion target [Nocardia]|uniref:WXG100 family type VII secretion target n=1 Tax=Nocardia TaxID=1817 RepID=UPI001894369A|nr:MULTISPECIES: hypothetical protein [Nocardia]MBF6351221.1 hypothetical protein [Nocardia flavorosea]